MHGRSFWSVPKYFIREGSVCTYEAIRYANGKIYLKWYILCDLAEVVLKNNSFKFVEKTLNQKRGSAIGTKFVPPYGILFMAELEEEILRKAEFKPYLWWRCIEDISFLWEHGEEKLKSFLDNINKMHPTITFTADWSKTSINF